MSSIDKRIVQMEFENQQFERNARTTIKTMDELKKNMDFDAASESLSKFDKTSKNFDLNPISSAVSAISERFSTMGIIGVTALQRITNQAMAAGERIAKELTIVPVKTGFDEYELKMGSVQTIMASTGESLETVNKYLEELNLYADKTIYSFSDMTNNIGKFTNAGVKLEDAVAAIKGISNEAAVSGANAQQASHAMYNFAQALSAGYVKVLDWKSIETANMATVEFKNELIKTALEIGTVVKEGDMYVSTTTNMQGKTSAAFDATRNFNETLQHQWMTTEVLTKTLAKYASETEDIGIKAYKAAQDVKTVSMMFDTLKEAVQSGWSATWEMIIGDFNQATEVLTNLTNVFGSLLDASAKARNLKLKEWLDVGGRDLLLASLYNVLNAILHIAIPIKEAFQEIFPPKTNRDIFSIMKSIRNFTKSLIANEKQMEQIKRMAKGLFAILDVGKTIVTSLARAGFRILQVIIGETGDDAMELGASIGDLLVRFRDWFKSSSFLNDILNALVEVISVTVKAVKSFITYIREIPAVDNFFSNFGTNASNVFKWIAEQAKAAGPKLDEFFNYFRNLPPVHNLSDLGNNIRKIGNDIWTYFSNLVSSSGSVKETVVNTFNTILDTLGPVGTGLRRLGQIFESVFDWIVGIIKQADLSNLLFAGVGIGVILALNGIAKAVESVTNVLAPIVKVINSASNALDGFAHRMNAEALYAIAKAIFVLVSALSVLCYLPHDRLWESVAILGILAAALIGIEAAAKKIDKVNWSIAGNILALSVSVGILVLALNALEMNGIKEKLGVLTACIVELGVVGIAMTKLGDGATGFGGSAATQVLALAASVWIIAHAFQTLAEIDDADIGRGLAVVETIILSLGIFGALINKGGKIGDASFMGGNGENATNIMSANGSSGAGAILAAAVAIHLIISAFKRIAALNPSAVVSGIIVIGSIFIEMSVLMAAMRLAGQNSAKAGAAILMISLAINLMVPAIRGLGRLSDSEISRATACVMGIGAIFTALIAATNLAGNGGSAALTMIGFSAALLLIPVTIKLLSGISDDELKRGLAVISVIGLVCMGLLAAMKNVNDIHKNLLMLTILIGIVGGVFIALAVIDPGNATSIGVALALVIASLAVVMHYSKDIEMSAGAVLELIALVAAVGGVLYLILKYSNSTDGAIEVAAAISLLVIALSASSILLGKNNIKFKEALPALGVIGILLFGVGGIVAALCQVPNINLAIDICAALSELIPILTICLIGLGVAGNLAEPAVIAALAIDVVIIVIGGLLIAIADLASYMETQGKDIMKSLDVGIQVFEKVGEAIGAFVSGAITKIGDGVATTIERIGEALGNFATAGQSFFDLVDRINVEKLMAVGNVSDAINALAHVDWEMFPTEDELTAKFTTIASALHGFAEEIGDVDTGSVESAANAAKIFAELESSMHGQGGFLDEIIGKKDIGEFGERLSEFADGFNTFAKKLFESKKFFDQDAIDAAVGTAKIMTEVESALHGQGGFLDEIIGKKDIGEFGQRLEEFIIGFNKAMIRLYFGKDYIDQDAVNMVHNIATMMSELENGLVGQGGFLQDIIGTQNIGDFGARLEEFIIGFNKAMIRLYYGKDYIDEEAIETVHHIATIMSELEENLDPHGGVVQWFTGDQTIDQFGTNLSIFADGIIAFGEKISGYSDNGKVDEVVKVATMLSDFEKELKPTGGIASIWTGEGALDIFGENMTYFGGSLIQFFNDVNGITFTDSTNKMIPFLKELLTIAEEFTDFKLAFDGVAESLKTFLDDLPDVLSDGSSSVQGLKEFGQDVIKYIYLGIQEGIANYGSSITWQGRLIGSYIEKGVREELEIQSPSVVMKKIGKYAVDGLVEGLEDNKAVSDASENMAKGIIEKVETTATRTTAELIKLNNEYIAWMRSNEWMLDYGVTMEELSMVGKKAVGLIEGNKAIEYAVETKTKRVMRVVADTTNHTTAELIKLNNEWVAWMRENEWMLDNGIALEELKEMGRLAVGLVEEIELPAIDMDSLTDSLKDTKDQMVEIGHYVLTGLAEGIEASDSAEEAAKKKADNIVKAFETGLKRIETLTKRYDLEEELWGLTEGKGATEGEKAGHELDTKIKKLEALADKVQDTQAKYKATVEMLGEESDYAKELYNDWLQSQIDLHTLANEITEAQNGTTEVDRLALNQMNREYNEFMQGQEDLLSWGFSLEEIQKAALNNSRLASVISPVSMGKDITSIIDRALQDVEVDVSDRSNLIAQSIVNGISSGMKQSGANLANNVAPDLGDALYDAGDQMGQNLSEGTMDGYSYFTQTVASKYMTEDSNALMDTLKKAGFMEESPSKFTYQCGVWLAEGLANGYSDGLKRFMPGMTNRSSDVLDLLSELGNATDRYAMFNGDFTPTITPVVDLSNVDAAIQKIDSSFNQAQTVAASVSANKVQLVSDSIGSSNLSTFISGLKSGAVTNNYNFTQNNSSPKALSRTEIYRQTKNQFSLFKEATK